MLKVLTTAAALAVATVPAAATSIIGYEEDRIISIAAETFVVAAYCGQSMQVNHDMRDLVVDILELKVGGDIRETPKAETFYAAVDRFEDDAKSAPNMFCLAALAKYGEDGKMVRGLVSKN